MIVVTESARNRLKEVLDHWKARGVRLEVKSGGCSGFMYAFSSIDKLADDDVEIDGLVLDPISFNMLDEATIDLKKDLMEEKFTVVNPKSTRRCGCGQSFC